MHTERTDTRQGLSRRTIMTAAAWAAPAIVATATSPAAAASSRKKITLELGTLPTVEEFSTLPSFSIRILEDGLPIYDDAHRLIVTLAPGLEWDAVGSGIGGSRTFATLAGRLVLGGSARPIAVGRQDLYPILVQLESDPSIYVNGLITVTAASAYAIEWAAPGWISGFSGGPIGEATSLTAMRDGAAQPGLAVKVKPGDGLSWTTGPQGERTMTTDASGKVDFAAGTFTAPEPALFSVDAAIAAAPAVTASIAAFAAPKEAADWVQNAWVRDDAAPSVVIDAAGFDSQWRIVCRIDGEYLMESMAGKGMYSTQKRAGDNVVQTSARTKLTGGERLEVFVAAGKPGEPSVVSVPIYSVTFVTPPADASTWVKQIAPAAPGLSVVFDRAALDGANRLQVRQNGVYLMESYQGTPFYSSVRYDGSNAILSHQNQDAGPLSFASGDAVEVYLAPGKGGQGSAGRWCIATYICP